MNDCRFITFPFGFSPALSAKLQSQAANETPGCILQVLRDILVSSDLDGSVLLGEIQIQRNLIVVENLENPGSMPKFFVSFNLNLPRITDIRQSERDKVHQKKDVFTGLVDTERARGALRIEVRPPAPTPILVKQHLFISAARGIPSTIGIPKITVTYYERFYCLAEDIEEIHQANLNAIELIDHNVIDLSLNPTA